MTQCPLSPSLLGALGAAHSALRYHLKSGAAGRGETIVMIRELMVHSVVKLL